jgi:hypothetical protein
MAAKCSTHLWVKGLKAVDCVAVGNQGRKKELLERKKNIFERK